MITILTSCWAATKKLLNDVNLPVVLSSISRSIRGLTAPVTFPVDTITTGSKSIRGTTANNFPSSLSN
jgi:hypothetical protein